MRICSTLVELLEQVAHGDVELGAPAFTEAMPECVFVLRQMSSDGIDLSAAGHGEAHSNAAVVVSIGFARHVAAAVEPVDAISHRARRHLRLFDQRAG